jgi:hypothetical protein
VRKMNALIVKMETVTLTGKGRQNLICFMYEINNKTFFLYRILFLGGHLRLRLIHTPLADVFYLGDLLRLESASIQ